MKVFYFNFLKMRRGLFTALILAGVAVFFTGVMLYGGKAREPGGVAADSNPDPARVTVSPNPDSAQVKANPNPAKAETGLNPASKTKTKSYAIYKVKTERKVAALTFDISWGTAVPGPIMDTLKKYNVKSTFFLSGPWVKKYPEFPRRLKAEGHEIASHGDRHIDLNRESSATVKEEITAAHQSIKEVTGVSPNLIRTPNGAWDEMVLNVADQLGYRVIQWSVDSLDWKKPGTDAIVKRVLDRVHPGAIILMHASDTCTQTPDALPRVLEGLKARGYELVTVSKLLEEGPGVVD